MQQAFFIIYAVKPFCPWEDKVVCSFTFYLLPLFFEFLLLLIYALNSLLNSDFELAFLPIISFIKISVAEKVAKLSEE